MGKKSRSKQIKTKTAGEITPPVKTVYEAARVPWKHIIVIALVCAVAYANTIPAGFVWDDPYQITENSQIKSLRNVPSLFTSEVWAGVEGEHRTPYYRPLFTLSLAFDYFLWGEKPAGFHFTNLLLHVLASVMAFCLAFGITRSRPAALFSALVFAVHPVHTEAVAWVSGRNEMLCAGFMFLSFYLYILHRDKGLTRYLAGSLVAFFLALLSKEMAVTLPLILFLYELYVSDGPLVKRLKRPVPFVLALVPYLVLRFSVLTVQSWTSFPFEQRFYTGLYLMAEYFRLLLLPVGLKVHYEVPMRNSLLEREVLFSLIAIMGVAAAIYVSRRLDRKIFWGLLFIVAALLPVSGFFMIIQPSPMADRYLYIPSFGFTMVLGLLFSMSGGDLLRNGGPHRSGSRLKERYAKAANVAGALLVAVLLVMTFQRNFVWKDQYSLATKRVADAPSYANAHYDLGLEFARQKRFDEAISKFNKALEIKPGFVKAYNNLGAVYIEKKMYDEALGVFQNAVKMNRSDANIHYNLGIIFELKGKSDEAAAAFREALALRPNDANIRYNLGVVYFKKGLLDEAAQEFQGALRDRPDHAGAAYNLGAIYMRQGRLDDAIAQLETAVSLEPQNPVFRKNLQKAHEIGQRAR